MKIKHIKLFSILLWLIIPFAISAQVFPENFLWSGCTSIYNGYESKITDTCKSSLLKLVFYDEFDSTALNQNTWQTLYPWGRTLHNKKNDTGWEKQYYTDDNVSVSGGSLHLRTVINPSLYPEPLNPGGTIFCKYTSGMVYTKQKFNKGKYEIRGKIPSIDGLWPAFWTYGECQQEMDVFEFNNHSQTSDKTIDGGNMIMTHHKSYDCNDKQADQCEHIFTKNAKIDLSLDFHTYSVEWNKNRVIWKLDGEIMREAYRLWTVTPPPPAGPIYAEAMPIKNCTELSPNTKYTVITPFVTEDVPLNIIINTAVLYDRASDEGVLPAEFLIDYLKVWEEVEIAPIDKQEYLIDFYPNPFSGVYFVDEFNLPKKLQNVMITDLLGREVVFGLNRENGRLKIDLTVNPPGIYFVQFDYDGCTFFKKLIFN